MKIGIYSDLHISYTSSIMPIYSEDSNYTTRLKTIIDTGEWASKLFDDNNVDLIVNCGDTFDKNIARSEELMAASEFLTKFNPDTKHIIITGNHEILDSNSRFYSIAMANLRDNICILNKPKVLELTDVKNGKLIKLSFLPYMKSSEITDDIIRELSQSDILFSHIDIIGSHLRPDYIMSEGVDPGILSLNFNIVINGHLHTAEEIKTFDNKLICNIGSAMSVSFSDNNNYIPSVCILDTDTMKIERFNNPHSILFRKFQIDSIKDLIIVFDKFEKTKLRYIIRVTTPYSLRDSVKQIIDEKEFIIASKIITKITESDNIVSMSDFDDSFSLSSDESVYSDFLDFLENNQESLNNPIGLYKKLIKEMTNESKESNNNNKGD